MPQRVTIPPPQGHGTVAALFSVGFGAIVIAAATALISFVGREGMAWPIGFCTFSPFVLIGLGLIALGWHFWRLRKEPLVIENGQVTYRGKVVFGQAAGRLQGGHAGGWRPLRLVQSRRRDG